MDEPEHDDHHALHDLHFLYDIPPAREPEQATALALLLATSHRDLEAVQAIIHTTDQPRLLAVMTGLAGLLAELVYGPVEVDGRLEFDEESGARASAAVQEWLTTGEVPAPPYVE